MPSNTVSKAMEHLRRSVLLRDGAGVSDGQLLDRFVEYRDDAAFEALVRRHGPMVWGTCRRIVASVHDAEDAFQATFLVLVHKAAAVKPREAVGNWLYGVACNVALKARATSMKLRNKERQASAMPENASVSRDQWEDLHALLDQELSRLPDKYRLPLVLCDLEGRARKEVAAQFKIPEGTLSSRLTTARKMLVKRLTGRGVAVSGGILAAVLGEKAASASVPASVVAATIKAITLAVAGKAAVVGAISPKVAALTEGTLKAMFISKLKIATAVLFVVAALIGAGASVCSLASETGAETSANNQKPAADGWNVVTGKETDQDKLQGTWRLISTEVDGLRFGEGRLEIKDTRLVIKETAVTLLGKRFHSPGVKLEPEDTKSVGTITLDTRKSPKVIALTLETNPWNDKKDITRRGIYVLEGDTLKMCLRQDVEDQTLPAGFSAKFGSKQVIWTFRREPTSVKAGKKAPTNKEKIIGTWKATLAEKKDRVEFGVFTFRDDGKFTLERDHFLDLAKGTYAMDGDGLKITVTHAVDGAPLGEGSWPVKVKSFSEKEIVLELKGDDTTALVHFARVPIPEGAWQAVEEDRKKLQGSWEYVGTEEDGKLVKNKESAGTITFKGEKVLEAGSKEYGIFTLSANRKLKAIQFRFSNGQGLANLGAYELDGDTLRICRDPDRVFPAEFKTKGTKNRIEEFKRAKK